jgi:SET domain-containing protein
VGEYVGVVFESEVRPQGHRYVMEVGRGLFIDAEKYGGFARFVNHSDNPNCEVQHWRGATGIRKMLIITTRKVLPNEEFSITYGKLFETSFVLR